MAIVRLNGCNLDPYLILFIRRNPSVTAARIRLPMFKNYKSNSFKIFKQIYTTSVKLQESHFTFCWMIHTFSANKRCLNFNVFQTSSFVESLQKPRFFQENIRKNTATLHLLWNQLIYFWPLIVWPSTWVEAASADAGISGCRNSTQAFFFRPWHWQNHRFQ